VEDSDDTTTAPGSNRASVRYAPLRVRHRSAFAGRSSTRTRVPFPHSGIVLDSGAPVSPEAQRTDRPPAGRCCQADSIGSGERT
jgi:hypothetical protein